ncbi:NAD-dependent epimerase/dehydratase family protein [Streptomyces thermocarboxydus]
MSSPISRKWEHAVVTGGAGFVGSHLCKALLDAGAAVTCVDDLSTGRPENVAPLLDRPGFTLVQANVAQELPVQPAARPGAALRLPRLSRGLSAAAAAHHGHRQPGTRNALTLAHESEARFVLASTSEVYGDPQQNPQDERYWGNVNPVGPRSARRGQAVRRGPDHRARGDVRHGHLHRAAVQHVRSRHARPRRPGGATFVRQALAGEPLTVTGDGRQTRSLCYVDDTVGILAAAAHGLRGPSTSATPPRSACSRWPAWWWPSPAPRPRCATSSALDDPAVRCPDITLARDKLGWEPRVGRRGGPAPHDRLLPRRSGPRLSGPPRRPEGPGGRSGRRPSRKVRPPCASSASTPCSTTPRPPW